MLNSVVFFQRVVLLNLANLPGRYLPALRLKLPSPLCGAVVGRQDHLPQHVDDQRGRATGG
jgi:hypothetical protein